MILNFFYLYRHDLKIYASDEGRVQMTAAAFAKGSGLPDYLLWGISVTLFIFKCCNIKSYDTYSWLLTMLNDS